MSYSKKLVVPFTLEDDGNPYLPNWIETSICAVIRASVGLCYGMFASCAGLIAYGLIAHRADTPLSFFVLTTMMLLMISSFVCALEWAFKRFYAAYRHRLQAAKTRNYGKWGFRLGSLMALLILPGSLLAGAEPRASVTLAILAFIHIAALSYAVRGRVV
ncbi:MAG: hypothetical protein AAGE89_11605 [Pseudomonadota bacterium]